ncbi:MAG: MFS transporter [Candidatus Bipolaricaulota bacterium]|nr:MFS transporter [Candidatus Bipolaricaulota bacterium]
MTPRLGHTVREKSRRLPRNIWTLSITSFLMDASSEMVLTVLPLFLSSVLGVKPTFIGLIEGGAESTASLLRVVSGWWSDRLGKRKWLAVLGYGISAAVRPVFLFANSWMTVALSRWVDRVGKGVRAAPRDALVADSVKREKHGIAFGFQRAADAGGTMLGIVVAMLAVWFTQGAAADLQAHTFSIIVIISIVPAALSVLALAIGARDVSLPKPDRAATKQSLGRPFFLFLVIVALFQLGNSADAFIILRARSLGANLLGILGMLVVFNLTDTLIAAPAGALSDRIPRKRLIVGGWLLYAAIYFGIAVAHAQWTMWVLYMLYGAYYGTAYGTARALVADLVPVESRGTAYGIYNTVIGVIGLPASILAGALWDRFGAPSPFYFGAGMALIAALALIAWRPLAERGKPAKELT